MPRKPKRTRITRTASKKKPKKPRGVKKGTARGPYNKVRDRSPLARPWLKPPVYSDFSHAPEHLRARAYEKRRWVARYVNDNCPDGKLPQYIADYAQAAAVPPEEIPNYQTVYRWAVRMYVFGEVGLLDSPPARAGKPKIVGWKEELDPDGNTVRTPFRRSHLPKRSSSRQVLWGRNSTTPIWLASWWTTAQPARRSPRTT
jgi:hypothetical protein